MLLAVAFCAMAHGRRRRRSSEAIRVAWIGAVATLGAALIAATGGVIVEVISSSAQSEAEPVATPTVTSTVTHTVTKIYTYTATAVPGGSYMV